MFEKKNIITIADQDKKIQLLLQLSFLEKQYKKEYEAKKTHMDSRFK